MNVPILWRTREDHTLLWWLPPPPLSGAIRVMASTMEHTWLSPFTSRIASPGNNPQMRRKGALTLTPFNSQPLLLLSHSHPTLSFHLPIILPKLPSSPKAIQTRVVHAGQHWCRVALTYPSKLWTSGAADGWWKPNQTNCSQMEGLLM